MTLKTLSVKELASPYLCLSHHADFPALRVSMGSLETDSRCKRSVAGATEKAGAEKAHVVPKPKKRPGKVFSVVSGVTGRARSLGLNKSNPGAKESEGARARARPHEYVSSALLSHTDEVFQAPRKENAKSQDVPGPKVSSISETSLAATEKAAFKDPEKPWRPLSQHSCSPNLPLKPVVQRSCIVQKQGRSLWQER